LEAHNILCDFENQQPIRFNMSKFSGGEELQFHYQLGSDPELRFVEVPRKD